MSMEIVNVGKELDTLNKMDDEVFQVNCGCCGQREDCTRNYIVGVKNKYGGTWVCGLCSEAIKEYLSKNPGKAMEEAVIAHIEICQNFNVINTDIAKRSLEQRMLRKFQKLNINQKL